MKNITQVSAVEKLSLPLKKIPGNEICLYYTFSKKWKKYLHCISLVHVYDFETLQLIGEARPTSVFQYNNVFYITIKRIKCHQLITLKT